MISSQLFTGKTILVIGAARQGLALSRFLLNEGAIVIINDKRKAHELVMEQSALSHENLTWLLGEHPQHLLDGIDMVCPSGGIPLTLPLIQDAVRRGIPALQRLTNLP